MSKRMKLVFTLSLLLNIVLIGAGMGIYIRMNHDYPGFENVSAEGKALMTGTFEKGREDMKPLMQTAKAQRQKVESILTAETFDLAAYTAAVDEMLSTRDEISRERARTMGQTLGKLSVEDRRSVAKKIISSLNGRKPHKGGYHHKKMEEGAKPQ